MGICILSLPLLFMNNATTSTRIQTALGAPHFKFWLHTQMTGWSGTSCICTLTNTLSFVSRSSLTDVSWCLLSLPLTLVILNSFINYWLFICYRNVRSDPMTILSGLVRVLLLSSLPFFYFQLSFYLIFVSFTHHASQSHSSLIPAYLPSFLAASYPQIKVKRKKKRKKCVLGEISSWKL